MEKGVAKLINKVKPNLITKTLTSSRKDPYFSNFVPNFEDDILREHNKKIYKKIIKGFAKSKKVLIEQATGTGKSYLAIKYLKDHCQGKKVLFVSPSRAIDNYFLDSLLKTLLNLQQEKLDGLSKQKKLNLISKKLNINFDTSLYQGLKGKAQNNYDAIIFDEAHRIGATTWGQSAEELMNNNPSAMVFGMSATLNRTDGVDVKKYFNKNKPVSVYSLENALQDGVLPQFDYALAKINFDDDVMYTNNSIADLKTKLKTATGEEKKKILELIDKLKKAQQMIADNDDVPKIMKKHFNTPHLKTGKFIVFCPAGELDDENEESVHHMKSIMKQTNSWFNKVEDIKKIKKYSVSSRLDAKTNRKVITAFEKDKTKSLKLLFSINMLNEGLHVDDIDGVIMLRSTGSHIIYLQQLGRALSVGKNKRPKIFDFVANLGEVDLQQIKEMFIKINSGKHGGKNTGGGTIKDNDEEQTIDPFNLEIENLDEMEFLNQLKKDVYHYNHRFDFDFEDFYKRLLEYKNENGDLLVPLRYSCNDEYKLGEKISCIRKGTINLTEEQKMILNSIGFVWVVKVYDGVRKQTKKFVQRYLEFKNKYNKEPSKSGDLKGEKTLYALKKKYTNAKILNLAEVEYLTENGLILRNEGDNIRVEVKRFVADYISFVKTNKRAPKSKRTKERSIYLRWLKYTNQENLTSEELQYIRDNDIGIREKIVIEDEVGLAVKEFVKDCLEFYKKNKRKPSSTTELPLYRRYLRYTNPKNLNEAERRYILDNNIERYSKDIIRPTIKQFVERLERFINDHKRMPRKSVEDPEERKLYGQFYRYTADPSTNLNEFEKMYLREHNVVKFDKDTYVRDDLQIFVREFNEFVRDFGRLPKRTLEENLYRRWLKYTNADNLSKAEIAYLKENNIEIREIVDDNIKLELKKFVLRYNAFIKKYNRRPKKISKLDDELEAKEERRLYKLWIKYSNADNINSKETEYLKANGIEVRVVKKTNREY